MASSQHLRPFASSRPTLVTALHSQVRQEAEYIQECIAATHRLHSSLKAEIARTEAKLVEARTLEGSRDIANSLKRNIRKKRSRLNRCLKNRQILEARLITIFADIARMERQQWRHSSPNLHGLGIADSPTGPSWHTHMYFSTPGAPGGMLALNVPTLQMQYQGFPEALYQSVPDGPQTPLIRPTLFSQAGIGHPHLQDFGVAQAGHELGISPTDTVSPCELSSPNAFPVAYIPAAQVNLVEVLDQMHISQPHTETSNIPTTAPEQRNLGLSQRLSMLDHQSAAFRLEKSAARKGRSQRSC
ncbi:hypothetical protein AYL99_01707 [Fonsecaea erecta]|uniref:Uncharacterized protein n=1 Tax=Fonsecaea erecta TaxID=1367422 RepID=A0A179A3K5_9EURO|nr:hypothetical protein AYL99_01707 [Fonsecaea erecta]OAP65735.1 hypothetical protein AYL99_01707 [Fonsecaea erecta]